MPVGDPWEYTLPTTLIQLEPNATLPEWHRELPPGADPTDPTYASNAPDGPWTWLDGPPPDQASSDGAAQGGAAAAQTSPAKGALTANATGAKAVKTVAKGSQQQPSARAKKKRTESAKKAARTS